MYMIHAMTVTSKTHIVISKTSHRLSVAKRLLPRSIIGSGRAMLYNICICMTPVHTMTMHDFSLLAMNALYTQEDHTSKARLASTCKSTGKVVSLHTYMAQTCMLYIMNLETIME